MNKHLNTIGVIVVIFALILTACSLPTAEKSSDNFPAIPTAIPEVIKDAVDEAEETAQEAVDQVPADISQISFMYYQEAEDYLLPYAEFLEGMIFTKAVDLEVVNIADDSAHAEHGHMFEALVNVRNNGFASSPQVKLSCEIPGTGGLGGWRWVAPLTPGESRDIRVGFTSSSMAGGTWDYTCTIDADNTLIELNKANNSKTITINPVMTNTDLMIVSVEEITRSAIIGYDHEFKVTIMNVGPERSYKVFMRCSYPKTLGAAEEQIVWVGPMANPGDTVQVICGFNGVPAGTHTLTVEVDSGHMIDEKNEKNNIDELTFKQR
ncbi:MAG: CARDB domain-containing protein [Anaerolineae bacterium]|jgi:hypothetical protein|nr:CARDB domain-containing protein [Anaerolineae bacterium]